MQLTVTGKQVDVGDALRRHVEDRLAALIRKYFRTAIEAHTVFSREAHLIRADVTLHVGRGMLINGSAAAPDHYVAFDTAAERLGKQLRRDKRRRRDYHANARTDDAAETPSPAASDVADDAAAPDEALAAPETAPLPAGRH